MVTGATGVLCGAMALFLAEKGAKMVLVGRNREKGEELERRITGSGGTAIFVPADVLNEEEVAQVRDQALSKYGRIDILINGAGGNSPEATTSESKTFFDLSLDAIKGVVDLNLIGTILPSQVIGKVFADQQSGVIVNVSSMAANRPATRVAGYSAAKSGIDNFTRWLAVYMNQNFSANIRVNAIAPGFFLTNQNYSLLINEETGGPTERGRKIIEHTPMGRYGQEEDLLGTLLWLVSDASRFVTGTVVAVDGGFSAYLGV